VDGGELDFSGIPTLQFPWEPGVETKPRWQVTAIGGVLKDPTHRIVENLDGLLDYRTVIGGWKLETGSTRAGFFP
jgi:hypothetical protein